MRKCAPRTSYWEHGSINQTWLEKSTISVGGALYFYDALTCKGPKATICSNLFSTAVLASRPVPIISCSSEQLITCMAQRSPGWWVSTLGLSPRRKSVIAIVPGWTVRRRKRGAHWILDGDLESSDFMRSSGSLFGFICAENRTLTWFLKYIGASYIFFWETHLVTKFQTRGSCLFLCQMGRV